MKILYHHRIRSKDGQYVHLSELTRSLRELGHEIRLVGPNIADDRPFGSDSGWVERLKRHCPRALYELLEFAYSIPDALRLAAEIHRFRPDFIYERYNLFLPSGIWAARLFSLPVLLEVNAPLADERAKYGGLSLKFLARWTERFTWRGADAVLPVTEVLAAIIESSGVPRDRIHVIPNGINPEDIARADPRPVRQRLGLSDGEIVIGFAGFLREWHGLDRVVRLMAEHGRTHLRFLVIGDGPARASLEAQARSLGVTDRLTVTGTLPRDIILDCVAAFDVALQPDVVDYASPLKLLEYLALGRAIVAPDKANIRELVSHGDNAWLFDPNSESAFEQAVLTLCGDAELRDRLGRAAAATIVNDGLTWTRNANRVTDIASRLPSPARGVQRRN